MLHVVGNRNKNLLQLVYAGIVPGAISVYVAALKWGLSDNNNKI